MDQVLQVNVVTATFVLGSLIPLVVGLITKQWASSWVKAAANVLLSVAGGILAVVVQTKGSISIAELVNGVFITLTTGNILHVAVYKPLGLSEAVQNVAPALGIGESPDPAPFTPASETAPTGSFTVLGEVGAPHPALEQTEQSPSALLKKETKPPATKIK